MKFDWFDVAVIARTGDPTLDGTQVIVEGVANDYGEAMGTIYIVERSDNRLFHTTNGRWKSITMTESCLDKVDLHALKVT